MVIFFPLLHRAEVQSSGVISQRKERTERRITEDAALELVEYGWHGWDALRSTSISEGMKIQSHKEWCLVLSDGIKEEQSNRK